MDKGSGSTDNEPTVRANKPSMTVRRAAVFVTSTDAISG